MFIGRKHEIDELERLIYKIHFNVSLFGDDGVLGRRR